MPAHLKHQSWETIRRGRSVPADGVSVEDWYRKLNALPAEHQRVRMPALPKGYHPGTTQFHPVRVHLQKRDVRRLVLGRTVDFHHEQMTGEHVRGGQLVFLPHAEHSKLLQGFRAGHAKVGVRLKTAHVQFNLVHAGGLFSSFGDFVSGVWDLSKSVGNFLIDQGPAILEAVSDILPASSPYLIAAKSALKTVAGVTKQVGAIRDKLRESSAAKERAQEAIDREREKVAQHELELIKRDASAREKADAKAAAKARLEKLKGEAKRVGAEQSAQKKLLAKKEKEEKAAGLKAEMRLKVAQKAAEKAKRK